MPRPGEDRSDVDGATQFNNIGPVPLPCPFFSARWGARGAECLPRDVRRRSSQATSRFDGITAHRCLCVRTRPGIMEARPSPERCPRQEPLGRNRPAAFTLCHKVSGPSALPPRFVPVDPSERDGND